MKRSLLSIAALLVFILAGLAINVSAQTQNARLNAGKAETPQQPLYNEYKGVRLGMTPQEVRAKLGDPVLKDAEMDYFVFSENLTAQIVYDAEHKVRTISVDYAGGLNAPDYRTVVGTDLETKADGSSFKMMRYPAQGFWVSYNRTAGPTVIVTVTIQKM